MIRILNIHKSLTFFQYWSCESLPNAQVIGQEKCKFKKAMAICLNNLKSEIKTLEKLFPKGHERFQLINASVDELTCRFITKNGKKYDIHANITVSFHIWFFFFSSFSLSSSRSHFCVFSFCFLKLLLLEMSERKGWYWRGIYLWDIKKYGNCLIASIYLFSTF